MNLIFIILALVASVKLYQAIKQIIANQKCLDDETIANYLSGKATQDQRNHLIGHVANCKKCEARFHSFDSKNYVEPHLIDD